MSDYEDIMDLLGPSVAPFEPSSREVSRPAPPTVRDTTSEANVWLPTSVAAHYKEYDRFGPAVDELEALIARDGLLTPIRISTDGEVAVVHEGNHRLQVADRIGIREVPAIVTLDSRVVSNGGRVTPLEPVLASWIDANEGSLRSFWGHRTAASAGKLYRGVRIDLGVDLSLTQPGTSIETVGQELQLGPQVLDALSRQGGLGTHWSTRPEIAERFALESSGNGGGTPVLITVNWDGSGEDKERTNTGGTWADEAEVTILPGTPLQVVSVKLGSGFADGVEVLHSDRYLDYASDFQGAGLPVPQGGPRTVTAGLSDEDRVSVAEEVMERSGNAGRTFSVPVARRRDAEPLGMDPFELQREWSAEAEGYVAQVLGRPGIRVDPMHWDLRNGGGQALTDGMNYIGLAGESVSEMTLLHEVAHIITRTQEGRGGHGPEFQEVVHQLYAQHLGQGAADTFANLVWPEGITARIASSDIIARGFGFDGVGFELAQKYMNGTMTGRDILQEIETKWGSVGIWWGSIGSSKDDFYGSASEARDYAGWSGDGSIEERWEDMLDLTGGQVDPSGWIEAEIRVVLIAKKPVRDYGVWNPTTENGEGSMWESTSFFEHGERLELVEVQYSFDGTTWKSEAAGGLTVTAHRTTKIHPYLQDLLNECETSETAGSDNAICEAFAGLPDYMIDTHPSANYLKSLQKEVASYETDNETYALVEELKSINRREINGFRTAGTRTDPGGVYRGINVQVLSHDEQEEVAAWANGNSFSMDDYQLAEPNYELVYRILDRLDSGGLGRHWSKDYDVSADFARDQGDGIELILIGHWEGEGVDQREFHRGWDGVQRPSNLPHEEEVTLYPGTPVTLVGMDIVTEAGFTHNIPVPNIQVTAGHDMKHLANRTAANDLRVHLYDSEGHAMFLEPDFEGNPWTYHPKVMDAVRHLADVAQTSGVYWHMDHNEWVSSTITDFEVFDGPNNVTHEIKEFPQLRGHYASRTAASAPSAPGILYRGIGLPLSEAQWEDVAEYQGTPSFANKILSYMTQGFFGIGSGSHWTTEFEVAKSFSQGGTGIPVVLVVDWDGQGEDVNDRVINNFGGEAEVTLLPGTQVKIVDLLYGPSLESIIPSGHGLKGWSIEASRTAAEPGGVLPWNPSHRGYTWITKTDGTLEAVTNDGVNRMFLHEYPYGWEWEVFDSLGFVEGGTFGMALKGGDALRDRANQLLAEFDTRAEMRTRGPSRGYQDDYTPAPNELWARRKTTSQRYAERLRLEGRR